ncbi:MAG: phospholipase [Sphingobacteriales bacterium 50-39]|nr:dienelactone hydrolase family protein [Sphingobacteriales bacterium]OJW58480.1 MAG: phospholipase [Sphingobacteriales bacterium 50-39]
MHTKNIITAGRPLNQADKALILVHGRGGRAGDILFLADELNVEDYALLAPQATGNTWYPYSFLAPPVQNEPWLSSALDVLKQLVADIKAAGISSENIYFLGFSQGACLTLEFVTRNATRFGGVVAFTGGLIGDRIYPENYSGDFGSTPVFIGTSDPDPHVPVSRVYATTNILRDRNAVVTEEVYPLMGHTISQQEIDKANDLIFNKAIPQI